MSTALSRQLVSAAPARRILKFGGTSVTGVERVEVIANVVADRQAHTHPIVVVSAQAGVTDLLLEAARLAGSGGAYKPLVEEFVSRHEEAIESLGLVRGKLLAVDEMAEELRRILQGIELLGECSPRVADRVVSFGELASAALVAGALQQRGIAADAIDAATLIVADDDNGYPQVDWAATEERVVAALGSAREVVPIVTGYLAASSSGVRTTLGRGGSDSTAAILGWALGADAVEIWTDVDGVMTADPRLVAEARPIRSLEYQELLELAHWGGHVVHPDAVRPLRDRDIPLVVRNTHKPSDPGTVVSASVANRQDAVRSLAVLANVAIVRMRAGSDGSARAGRVLHALEQAGVRTLVTSQAGSEGGVWVAVPEAESGRAVEALRRAFASELRAGTTEPPTVGRNLSTVSLVGTSRGDFGAVASGVITVLAEHGIDVRGLARGSEAPSLSCIVEADAVADAVRVLHDAFFPERPVDDTEPALRLETSTDDVVELAQRLVDVPSVTGSERAVVELTEQILIEDGWQVSRQSVSPGRDNLWATRGKGAVTLSTHLDTVPGAFGSRVEDGRLYGRGACDAKGIAAAMIVAANRLARAGEDRVDLLFVVGEERRSDGARAANQLPATSRYLVNGEPTEGHLASGAKGTLQAVVRVDGVEAHSAYPEEGQSAVHDMVALLGRLQELELPTDPRLGPTTLNVGTIEGGSAPNVLAGSCEASLMIRLVGDPDPVREQIETWAGDAAEVTWVSHVPAQHFKTLPGFETSTVGYTTDASLLDAWGTPLLYGPGSIHVAHTPDEYVTVDALETAVEDYQAIVTALLA